MKRLLLSALLGMSSLAASAQTTSEQSAPDQTDQSIRVPGRQSAAEYQIELPAKIYPMFAGDFDAYTGPYAMSNGGALLLSSAGPHLYAYVNNGPSIKLVAAASNVFVAVDRQLKLTLHDDPNGPVTGEMLLAVPKRAEQAGQAGAAGSEVIRLMTSR